MKILIADTIKGTEYYRKAFDSFQVVYKNLSDHFSVPSVSNFDGVLLPGGCDVNPKRYGQENLYAKNLNDNLDDVQFQILEEAIRLRKPVLGICRGHQVIHSYFGGSLIQDIPTQVGKEIEHRKLKNVDGVHEMIIPKESYLYPLYGERCLVNSSHHQSVKELGKGMVLEGSAPDGIVEASRHESLPIWTVQYHPERLCFLEENSPLSDGRILLNYWFKQILSRNVL